MEDNKSFSERYEEERAATSTGFSLEDAIEENENGGYKSSFEADQNPLYNYEGNDFTDELLKHFDGQSENSDDEN